jgi:hypothetical protein
LPEPTPTADLPLRFYTTAPLFVIVAGLLMARDGSLVFISRWLPGALAATHLIALGCLAQVLCGVAVQGRMAEEGTWGRRRLRLSIAHVLLTLGTMGLGWTLAGGPPALLVPSAGAVALGLLICSRSAAPRPRLMEPQVWAAIALVVTALLGVALTPVLAGWVWVPHWTRWVDVHAAWGLLAWIGLLVIGVVPQAASPHLAARGAAIRWTHWIAAFVIVCGAGASAAWIIGFDPLVRPLLAAAAVGTLGLAIATLGRLVRARPGRLGPMRWHWTLALSSLCIAGVAWALGGSTTLVGMLVVVGVGVGLPTAWIFSGLSRLARGSPGDPATAEDGDLSRIRLVSSDLVHAQFVVQLITLVVLSMAFIAPDLLRLAGVSLTLSGFLLFVIVTRAAHALRAASVDRAAPSAEGRARDPG